MGISATCKGYDQGLSKSAQHCLMECTPAQHVWNAFRNVWNEWGAANRLHITWPFVLLGDVVATLALGSRRRQRGCKGAGQEEAWESHQRLPRV